MTKLALSYSTDRANKVEIKEGKRFKKKQQQLHNQRERKKEKLTEREIEISSLYLTF